MAWTMGITGRRATVCGFFALLLCLLAGSAYMAITHAPPGKRDVPHALPLDAESLVDGFRFSYEFPGGSLKITGKRFVRRGRKFFAVRSTLMKANFFEDISGAYRDKSNNLEFAAEKGEWELVLDKPLELRGIRRLRINGADIMNAPYAVIDFSEHRVNVYGKMAKTYVLKQ